jgi:hypothetical protein
MNNMDPYCYMTDKDECVGRYLAESPMQAAQKIFSSLCRVESTKIKMRLKFKIRNIKTKETYTFMGSQGETSYGEHTITML